MKRILINLFILFFMLNVSYANSNSVLPDEVTVREHWISLTKSYDIETKTQKLGTLYRRFFSFLLTYDFYDPLNVKTLTAKARFFSLGVHLDIYDQTDAFIGEVEEKIFAFFPTFEIIDRDSATKLARAEMNFWATKFYIYDPLTNQEMAIMSRPFFRLKNDWTMNVTNRMLLEQKNIDSRVLMTVLAVQGEIEDWQKRENEKNRQYYAMMQQLTTVSLNSALDKLAPPRHSSLEALAAELDQGFKAEYPSFAAQSNEEQVNAFTTYCLNLASSPEQSDTKKKAILTLLNLRLQGHP